MARPRIHKTKNAKSATVNITFPKPGQKAAWAELVKVSNEYGEKNLTGFCRSILMNWVSFYKLNEKKALVWLKPEQQTLLASSVNEKKERRKKRKTLPSSAIVTAGSALGAFNALI